MQMRRMRLVLVSSFSLACLGSLTAPTVTLGQDEGKKFGTGFVVSNQGHIVTNNHVVAGCRTLATRDGKTLQVLSKNPRSDLALLQANFAPTNVAVFRTGPAPKLGDEVVAFGFPAPGSSLFGWKCFSRDTECHNRIAERCPICTNKRTSSAGEQRWAIIRFEWSCHRGSGRKAGCREGCGNYWRRASKREFCRQLGGGPSFLG